MAATKPIPDILDGLNARLVRARQLYGPNRPMAAIVGAIYAKLDRLRQLYGSNDIEGILDGIIERKERLNRLVEVQSKTIATIAEQEEIQMILRQFRRHIHNLTIDEHEEIQMLMRQFKPCVYDMTTHEKKWSKKRDPVFAPDQ
jgi:hypothetical protein